MSYVGTKIKELRNIYNMSQEELGRRIGVQRAAIQKYEKGTVTNIPLQTIEQIAKVFDVTPTFLVGWHDHEASLSADVRTINAVKYFYGKDAVNLLEAYTSLTPTGRKRVNQYIEDIGRIYESHDITYKE